jgi:hypothetical protein
LKIQNTVNSEFAHRLQVAMTDKAIKVSPTLLTNLFNANFSGRKITPHTARNWILGKSFPTQEKLVHLALLLDTSAEQLRYGRHSEKTFVINAADGTEKELTSSQQQFVRRYLLLSEVQQQLLSKIAEEFNGLSKSH